MSWHRNHKGTEGRIIWVTAMGDGESMGVGARYFRVHILKVVSTTKLYKPLLPHLKEGTCKAYFMYL